jgi:hypothetical protein
MIFLASTASKLQIVTSAAGQINVHASWVDLAGTTVTASTTNSGNIATATTTDIVAAPAASTVRNVKSLKIGNNHASVSNTVTLQHTDGTNVVILEQVTLAPLERIGYEEGVGIRVFDAIGREKTPGLGLPTGSSNTADVTANAADTYLQGGNLLIGGRIQAGSYFKWRFRVSKTGAGTVAPIFNIRLGTAGAVGDTARVTHTSTGVQTGVVDSGMIELDANFRAVGASAVLQSSIRMDHVSADAAGLGTFRYLSANSATFDATPVGTIIGVSVNPGTLGVWTFQEVIIEAGNLLS